MSPDELTLIARLRALLELLPPALDRQVAPFGLTSYEFALLDAVSGAAGGRLRLSQLATSTHATLPRLSRVVSAMERKGLLERQPSSQDARATEAVLTRAGRAVLRAARPKMQAALQELVIDPLGASELRSASSAIRAIVDALDPEGRLAVLTPPDETGGDSPIR